MKKNNIIQRLKILLNLHTSTPRQLTDYSTLPIAEVPRLHSCDGTIDVVAKRLAYCTTCRGLIPARINLYGPHIVVRLDMFVCDMYV